MKAWVVRLEALGGILLHAEDRNKARQHACELVFDKYDYLDTRAVRVPELDGQAFTQENVVLAGVFDWEDDDPEEIVFINECSCPICREK